METCKHSKERNEVGLCWGCKANRKAAYDLTGTHDPEEQDQYWKDVWTQYRKLKRAAFKRKLQG
jgi:hypothetical protein